jgi:hypothetical protein
MGTFQVQARSYTDSSVVNAIASYLTTNKVLYTKKVEVTGDVNAVLPSQGGSLDAGELYNSDAFTAANVGDQKYIIIASADENNNENVSLYSIIRATGHATADAELLLADLAPGKSIAIPFHTNGGDNWRDELPRFVATRENTGDVPKLEITINY